MCAIELNGYKDVITFFFHRNLNFISLHFEESLMITCTITACMAARFLEVGAATCYD